MVYTIMKDKQYKPFCYRLNEKTNEEIKKIAQENNVSKNLLFVGFIKLVKKYGLPKMSNEIKKKKKT